MALSGRGGLGSLGGGMGGGLGGGFWHQQRSLGYLRAGAPNVRRTLLRVWRCLRPYRGQLALGTAVMLAGVGLGLVPPLLIRALIDVALPRREPIHPNLESP